MGRKTSPHPKQIAKRTSTDPSRRNRFIQTPAKGLVARNRYCSGKGGRRGNGESFIRCSLFVVRYPSFATRRSLLAIRRSPSADRGGTGVSSPVQQEQRSCPSIKEKFAPVFWSFGAHMGVRTIRESRTTDSTSTLAAASGVLRLQARRVFPRSPASWRSAGFL